MKNKSVKKIKWGKVIIVALVVIGGLTVLDNIIRLGKEVGNTVSHHQWNLVVVK